MAESTGKSGRGILPVADEPLGTPDDYGDDRVLVHLQADGGAEEPGVAQNQNGVNRQELKVSGEHDDNSGGNRLFIAPGVRVNVGGREQTLRVLGNVKNVAQLRELTIPTGSGEIPVEKSRIPAGASPP